MSTAFSNITIVGGGLLGGSLAMALAALPQPPRVRLWARQPTTVIAARELGISGATNDLAAAVASADLLVLAVPVGAMPDLVAQAVAAGLPAGCLVTDVGSIKRAPHHDIPAVLAGHHLEFIGSHPMAGSERHGLAAATANLFHHAACLLTNDQQVPAPYPKLLENLWQSIGCRTTWLSAADHDALVARISHLPHILAASAARVCLHDPAAGRFGGGGLRDTTRIASGNPEMWAEILIENRAALLDPLRETIADLGTMLALLENAEQQATCQWLATAKHQRDLLHPSC